MQDERVAVAGAGVVLGVVSEAGDAGLQAAPEDEQLRRGERRQAHQAKAVGHRVDHPFEDGVDNDRIRLHAAEARASRRRVR